MSTGQRRVRDPAQTRRAIIEALLELLDETGRTPTADAIAARAGVSRRSVFVHFSDLDQLHIEAARRQGERLLSMVEPISPDLPLAERVRAFAAQLERLYEAMTPVRRVALVIGASSPVVAGLTDDADVWLRGRLAEVFARELIGRDPRLLDAVDAGVSWAAWYHLRRLSRPEARQRLELLLTTLLAPGTHEAPLTAEPSDRRR